LSSFPFALEKAFEYESYRWILFVTSLRIFLQLLVVVHTDDSVYIRKHFHLYFSDRNLRQSPGPKQWHGDVNKHHGVVFV